MNPKKRYTLDQWEKYYNNSIEKNEEFLCGIPKKSQRKKKLKSFKQKK